MKAIVLKTNIKGEALENSVQEVLNNQNDVCGWDIDYSTPDHVLTIHVKELLNEDFIYMKLHNVGIKTEPLKIEQIPSNIGPVRSTCD